MATKNIVPRGNNEGQLGTDSKKWNKQIAVTGSFEYISGSLRDEDVKRALPSNTISSSAQLATQISGSFTSTSSSLAGRISTAESELGNTLISSSAQIASDISGSFTTVSSSLASRITTEATNVDNLQTDSGSFSTRLTTEEVNIDSLQTDSGSFSTRLTTEEANIDTLQSTLATEQGYIDTLESKVGQSLNTSDSPTFAKLTLTGDITAQNYIVSSSVTYMTSSFSSGSTIFGDTLDDIHRFTGSLFVSGNLTAVNLTADSSSFSSRITTAELELGNTLISSSAQIASDISGSFTTTSSSLASRITTEATNVDNLQTDSGSFSTRLTTAESELGNTLISSSAQIASDISGSLGVNALLIRSLTASTISGSFTAVSSSLASRLSTEESNIDTLQTDSGSFSTRLTTEESNVDSLQTDSGSFSTRLTTEEANVDSLQTDSGSFSTRITTEESNVDTLQSTMTSEQTNIDNLQTDSGSFSTRLTTEEANVDALQTDSGSFSTRITTEEANIDNLQSTLSTEQGYIDALQSDSGSFSTRITTEEANIDTLQSTLSTEQGYIDTLESKVGQSLNTSDSPTFAGLTTTGDITARNYIVSSSVTYMTSSFSSGSTIFGDDITDTHLFTGSLFVSGNLTAVNLTADSSSFSSRITTAELELGNTLISSSAQIASDISGSFTAASSSLASRITTEATNVDNLQTDSGSFSTRLTTAETELGNTLISSSAQIASDISGSLGTNASIIRGLTNVSISGSFTGVSSSLASRITTEEANVDSLQTDSGSFSTRLTTAETELGNTLISSSAQIASDISGSFTTVSSSLASRITTREAFITQSFSDGTATIISGSSTSTGSFGHILKGGVNWDTAVSSSAATAGFGSGGGGGSSFTSAGISGSFTQPSSSFSTRVSDLENPGSVTADFGGYTFSQGSAATTWNITHNLNSQYPNVTVYDSNDEVIIPSSITANTVSSSTIVFPFAVSGKAHYSVGGNMSGSADSTGSFGLILGDGSQLTNLPASYTSAQISGSFTTVSSSLASRITTREAFITQSFSDGTTTLISGSIASTGSFGHILKGGVNWDTAVSTSAAAGGFSGGGGSSFTSAGISGSWQSYSLISGSGQIATAISGAFTSTSGSFSTRVSNLENPESVTADFGGYTFSTSSAQTTWSITHNLNSQYPNVTVYDSNDEVIIPLSITANTVSSSTIVFDSPVSGKAHYSVGGNMSGSADSTGSFGHIQVVGDFLPTTDNSSDLGSSTKRFANIHSADVQLSNEGTEGNEVDGTTGSWTIQEGEDDLYLLNRKNGKKYRFKLEEIK